MVPPGRAACCTAKGLVYLIYIPFGQFGVIKLPLAGASGNHHSIHLLPESHQDLKLVDAVDRPNVYLDNLLRRPPAYFNWRMSCFVWSTTCSAVLQCCRVAEDRQGAPAVRVCRSSYVVVLVDVCEVFFLRFMCLAGALLIGCRLADGLYLGPMKFFLGTLLSIMKTVVLPWLMRRPTIRCSACL